jgi:hypothetical protein
MPPSLEIVAEDSDFLLAMSPLPQAETAHERADISQRVTTTPNVSGQSLGRDTNDERQSSLRRWKKT